MQEDSLKQKIGLTTHEIETLRILLLEQIATCCPSEWKETLRQTLRKLPPPDRLFDDSISLRW